MTSCEEAASTDRSGRAVRQVRAGQISVLGGVLQQSPGPEATTAERTWKETLGWDDSFEPASTEVRVSKLA